MKRKTFPHPRVGLDCFSLQPTIQINLLSGASGIKFYKTPSLSFTGPELPSPAPALASSPWVPLVLCFDSVCKFAQVLGLFPVFEFQELKSLSNRRKIHG